MSKELQPQTEEMLGNVWVSGTDGGQETVPQGISVKLPSTTPPETYDAIHRHADLFLSSGIKEITLGDCFTVRSNVLYLARDFVTPEAIAALADLLWKNLAAWMQKTVLKITYWCADAEALARVHKMVGFVAARAALLQKYFGEICIGGETKIWSETGPGEKLPSWSLKLNAEKRAVDFGETAAAAIFISALLTVYVQRAFAAHCAEIPQVRAQFNFSEEDRSLQRIGLMDDESGAFSMIAVDENEEFKKLENQLVAQLAALKEKLQRVDEERLSAEAVYRLLEVKYGKSDEEISGEQVVVGELEKQFASDLHETMEQIIGTIAPFVRCFANYVLNSRKGALTDGESGQTLVNPLEPIHESELEEMIDAIGPSVEGGGTQVTEGNIRIVDFAEPEREQTTVVSDAEAVVILAEAAGGGSVEPGTVVNETAGAVAAAAAVPEETAGAEIVVSTQIPPSPVDEALDGFVRESFEPSPSPSIKPDNRLDDIRSRPSSFGKRPSRLFSSFTAKGRRCIAEYVAAQRYNDEVLLEPAQDDDTGRVFFVVNPASRRLIEAINVKRVSLGRVEIVTYDRKSETWHELERKRIRWR